MTDIITPPSDDNYEPIDARRMWGVFDSIGYSADPIALFRTEASAEAWLAWDASRGDDRAVCCETCICPVDDLEGRVWNSTDKAPDPGGSV